MRIRDLAVELHAKIFDSNQESKAFCAGRAVWIFSEVYATTAALVRRFLLILNTNVMKQWLEQVLDLTLNSTSRCQKDANVFSLLMDNVVRVLMIWYGEEHRAMHVKKVTAL